MRQIDQAVADAAKSTKGGQRKFAAPRTNGSYAQVGCFAKSPELTLADFHHTFAYYGVASPIPIFAAVEIEDASTIAEGH